MSGSASPEYPQMSAPTMGMANRLKSIIPANIIVLLYSYRMSKPVDENDAWIRTSGVLYGPIMDCFIAFHSDLLSPSQ